MDRFVAIVRKQMAPFDERMLAQSAARAVEDVHQHGEVASQPLSTDGLIFAWNNNNYQYSDSSLLMPTSGGLNYVSGQVAYIEDGKEISPDLILESGDRLIGEAHRVAAIRAATESSGERVSGIENLSGSFHAIAYDPAILQTVVLVDRLGSRPIFYFQDEEILYLSSHVSCLLSLPKVDAVLDKGCFIQLIRFQTMFEDRSIYRDIKTVPPGTILTIAHNGNRVAMRRYWQLSRLTPIATRGEAIESTARVFLNATRRILANSIRVGLFLSGGMDSRMILACMAKNASCSGEARTFGPGATTDSRTAERLAGIVGWRWEPVLQQPQHYWENAHAIVKASNGLYSLGHAHTNYPARVLADEGFDTGVSGWGIDLLFSGSYLPKQHFPVFGRDIYTYRLGDLRTKQAVIDYLHRSLDAQGGEFDQSMLNPSLRDAWESSGIEALQRLVDQAQQGSESPYDWIDYVLFGTGIAKFRSFSMITGMRQYLRERNPLFESDVLDLYGRLPVSWRFLGSVFRRALLNLNPTLARVTYSNVSASPLAPPLVQALSYQMAAARQANADRIRRIAERIGFSVTAKAKLESYPTAEALARQLVTGTAAAHARQSLLEGPLAASGLINIPAVESTLRRCAMGQPGPYSTLVTLASVALWLETYPVST
jgi:hypothetical protein